MRSLLRIRDGTAIRRARFAFLAFLQTSSRGDADLFDMPRSLRILVPLAALVAGAALVAAHGGCSRKGAPAAAATVRGKVTFQGEPLAGGTIVFSPDPDRGGGGKPARGDLAADGSFELKLAGESAIPPGWYRVSFAAAPATTAAVHFPADLARPDASKTVREVKAGEENRFEFAIDVPGR
jgi:hypothetical protein